MISKNYASAHVTKDTIKVWIKTLEDVCNVLMDAKYVNPQPNVALVLGASIFMKIFVMIIVKHIKKVCLDNLLTHRIA